MSEKSGFDQWCILELLGHVKVAGRVTEVEVFGTKMGRIDIPMPDDKFATQYFGASSVYRLTPTTEEMARHVAASNQPAPVHRWELPAPKQTVVEEERATVPDYDPAGNDDDDEDSGFEPPF